MKTLELLKSKIPGNEGGGDFGIDDTPVNCSLVSATPLSRTAGDPRPEALRPRLATGLPSACWCKYNLTQKVIQTVTGDRQCEEILKKIGSRVTPARKKNVN